MRAYIKGGFAVRRGEKIIYFCAAFFAALVRRDTLRLARFFGMTLFAAFINLLSADFNAGAIAAASFDSMALIAFFTTVRVAFLREMFTLRFFSVIRIRFLLDLWFANFFILSDSNPAAQSAIYF